MYVYIYVNIYVYIYRPQIGKQASEIHQWLPLFKIHLRIPNTHTCVLVITTAQLHSIKPKLRFCAGSNPARGVSEIRDGEDL